jgi:hypothetical protein
MAGRRFFLAVSPDAAHQIWSTTFLYDLSGGAPIPTGTVDGRLTIVAPIAGNMSFIRRFMMTWGR